MLWNKRACPCNCRTTKPKAAPIGARAQTTLQMVREARERGLDVQMDQYPYPAFMTALSIQALPRYALNGSGEDLTARLSDPAQRQAIAS